LNDLRDLTLAVQRSRRLLDLDADPVAVGTVLGADPLLAPLVAKAPGLRSPGHVDGAELALRAVVGQQVSLGAAATHTARLVATAGAPLPAPDGGLTHLFPEPAAVAELDDAHLAMPDRRRRTVRSLAARLADGTITIDPGTDRSELERQLTALDGVGPWTAAYIALRGLGDPDVFLAGDLGVRRALERLGRPGDARNAAARAESWRPWRSYALHHLWARLS
ncbi:MAG TPA: AlkA N-terminal domain-containing protein, partial [Acidimicrobiales bacterium]